MTGGDWDARTTDFRFFLVKHGLEVRATTRPRWPCYGERVHIQSVRMLEGGVGLPVLGVANCLWVDAEFLIEVIYECIGSFDLVFGWEGCFSVGYYADSYGLVGAVPCEVGRDRPLSLPSFS